MNIGGASIKKSGVIWSRALGTGVWSASDGEEMAPDGEIYQKDSSAYNMVLNTDLNCVKVLVPIHLLAEKSRILRPVCSARGNLK